MSKFSYPLKCCFFVSDLINPKSFFAFPQKVNINCLSQVDPSKSNKNTSFNIWLGVRHRM